MLPRFPAGAGTQEIGSKRKGKRGKEEFLKGKCNQGLECILKLSPILGGEFETLLCSLTLLAL